MTFTIGTVLSILSAVGTVAGAGISYSAQMNAAKQADALAMMNMQSAQQAARQNAALQAQAQTMQAAQERSEAGMQDIQAKATLARTEAEAQQGAENLRRANAASEAMQARLRAQAGGSNVNPDTLSPLDQRILEVTMNLEDQMAGRDAINRRYQAGVLESFAPRAGAVQSMLRAGFLTAAAENSIVDGRLAVRAASIEHQNELLKHQGLRDAAKGDLFSAIGSAAGDIYKFGKDIWPSAFGKGTG